jgi:hypothetical protein
MGLLFGKRRGATGDVFYFINNSHRTDPKENATAA